MSNSQNELEKLNNEYLVFVKDALNNYSKIKSLMMRETISSIDINTALARYLNDLYAIDSETRRLEANVKFVQKEFKKWYNAKFQEVKKEMYEEEKIKQDGKKSSTIKLAVSEIETALQVKYEIEYDEWQNKLIIIETKLALFQDIKKAFEKYDITLHRLARNMEVELKNLYTADIESNEYEQEENKDRVTSRRRIAE